VDSTAVSVTGYRYLPSVLLQLLPGWDGILKHGIYHQRKKLGVDESVMWGEYFFLSALDKALRKSN
jgi:unsaturated chondroitin disaccharide hydrolase